MSVTFEPREVERPFRKRWVRTTLQLMGRSPVRFCAAIALLAWLDLYIFSSVEGLVIPRFWFDWLGLVLAPVILAVVTAIARGADDRRQTWSGFAGFRRARLWAGTLGAGAVMVAIQWLTIWLLSPQYAGSIRYVHEPGRVLDSFAASGLLIDMILGICYVPLLVFEPLSERETRELSQRATQVNGRKSILGLLLACAIAFMLTDLIPTYGIAQAASLVFLGTLGYVAYRDIFERRSANLPEAAAAASVPAVCERDPVSGSALE